MQSLGGEAEIGGGGIRGHSQMMSAKFSGFLTPSPPCQNFYYRDHATSPSYRQNLGTPLPPLSPDVICACPLTAVPISSLSTWLRYLKIFSRGNLSQVLHHHCTVGQDTGSRLQGTWH